jgi:hypothetical protein
MNSFHLNKDLDSFLSIVKGNIFFEPICSHPYNQFNKKLFGFSFIELVLLQLIFFIPFINPPLFLSYFFYISFLPIVTYSFFYIFKTIQKFIVTKRVDRFISTYFLNQNKFIEIFSFIDNVIEKSSLSSLDKQSALSHRQNLIDFTALQKISANNFNFFSTLQQYISFYEQAVISHEKDNQIQQSTNLHQLFEKKKAQINASSIDFFPHQ